MKRVLPLALLVVLAAACGSKDITPRATGIPTTSTTATTLAPLTFEEQATPKVLADCQTFQERPTEIVVFCADAGLILDGLSWDAWGADRATGTGTAHAKLCEPNCAEGALYEGPVGVVLAKPLDGNFSELVVDWKGHDPNGSLPETYELPTKPLQL